MLIILDCYLLHIQKFNGYVCVIFVFDFLFLVMCVAIVTVIMTMYGRELFKFILLYSIDSTS